MSGLAGVRWLDSARPARIDDVRGPLAALAHRGPDGLYAATAGPCASGVAQFTTVPEGGAGHQPFRAPSGLLVALDGRIDNREELCDTLGVTGCGRVTDTALVAHAWEQWRVDALVRVSGDFALAVWDVRSHTLWLARDVFGIRPLYYRVVSGGVWWASELQALARLGHVDLDEGMAGEYLAESIRSETDTLVRGITRVPRASVLTVHGAGTMRVSRYWSPVPRPTRASLTDAQAVEEFNEIFATAVRARVRSDRPVAVFLSGGLDSSLVTASAAAIARAAGSTPVEALTLDLPGHPADESPFASTVAEHLRVPHTICSPRPASLADVLVDAERALDLPMPHHSLAADTMSAAVRARDLRVCLTGAGGNEWFSGHHFPFADQLRRLQFRQMAARMRAFRRDLPGYRPWPDLRLALWLQLPEAARRRLRPAVGRSRVPVWMNANFASRIGLRDRLQVRTAAPPFPDRQQRVMFECATSADKVFSTEYAERISAAAGCEERAPFLDRRLAEWALQLPDDQRWRNGAGKAVLRHAAAGVLPESIVARELGPDFSFQMAHGLRAFGGAEWMRSIARERAGWVNPVEVEQLWASMEEAEQPNGRRLGYYAWVLWMLAGTHLAARALERAPAYVTSSAPVLIEPTTRGPLVEAP